MGRTIIVGDVHGCSRELEELLAYVGFTRDDDLVLVGDLVVRGPNSHAVVQLCRKLGARTVRGNHEDRLLRWRASRGTPSELRISAVTRRAGDDLSAKDWTYLERMPLWIDLPNHSARVVHAGLMPGLAIEQHDPRVLMYVRSLGGRGEALEERGARSWSHAYAGPLHVVYGHDAQREPEIAEHATGIDTGAVYGGRLTAMVLREGETVPPPAERRSVLVSVPARKAYFIRDSRPSRTGAEFGHARSGAPVRLDEPPSSGASESAALGEAERGE